ncbi:MAG: type I-E CRISPR-associated endonuclease Cas1e [Actinomycetia bacterium]|nr:type I-E CRISPR-associated endonuclease Cas1e [Actinomycetes bacterium]
MRPIPGMHPASVGELARATDRMSFLYLERAVIHRADNAITVSDERGVVHVPAAMTGALLLGPGTTISHQAMMLLGDSGCTVLWVGERGVRYYGHARPLARSSRLLMAQAELVTNERSRLRVARQMYEMRFAEDVTGMTMQQLRGREGARVRRAYRAAAQEHGVKWSSRSFVVDDFEAGDDINQALSAATACLYGLVHSVVVALGCSPGLGFIHTGHDRSFVYDISDLYKVEIAVPVAFRTVASGVEDVPAVTRRAMRDAMYSAGLLERCTRDIHRLLGSGGEQDTDYADVLELWGPRGKSIAAGHNLGDDDVPW